MSIDLTNRSTEQELMDSPEVDQKQLNIALADVSRVNRLLGGNGITIDTVFEQIKKIQVEHTIKLCDLGCGDGEMLRKIADKAREKNIKIKLIGLDISAKCVQQAKNLSILYPEIQYHIKNVLTIQKDTFSCDIMICTLTLHHLNDAEIKQVLQKCIQFTSQSMIINDLHRSALAYRLFKIFSMVFIKSFIAKHDGLISIKRGFKKNELEKFAKELPIKAYQIDWKWAFRYRWIIYTN